MKPRPDEHIASFVHRLGLRREHKRYETTAALLGLNLAPRRLVGMPAANACPDLERAAGLTPGVLADWLFVGTDSNTLSFRGHELHPASHHEFGRRFCPACLAEDRADER